MEPQNRFHVAETLLVVLFFAAITWIMYLPISMEMGELLPDRMDSYLHTWEIAWNVHKFKTGISGIWDANIFWPHPDSLAYTEHLLTQSIVALPFMVSTGNPVLAHNAVDFIGFVLCGLGAYLLVRYLTGNRAAALAGGIIYAYCPWRFGQLGHSSQLLFSQWLPFALLFLHKTFDTGRRKNALIFGFFMGLNALASFYLAAMGAVVVSTVVVVELVRHRKEPTPGTRRGALLVVMGLLLAAAMVAPTVPPYYRVAHSQGLSRTLDEAADLSADPLDYLSAHPSNFVWGNLTRVFANRNTAFVGEHRLFPGMTVIVMAIFGFLGAARRKSFPAIKTYAWVVLVSFVFSLGPWLHVGWRRLPVPLPYALAFFLPGFGGLRAPSRFALVVELGLMVLAAFGFKRLLEWGKTRGWRLEAGTLIPALMLVEFFSAPVPHKEVPTGEKVPEVYRWLARQEGNFAIVELPKISSLALLPEEKRKIGDPLGFRYMYYSTCHWKKMVNGHSGFVPPTAADIFDVLRGEPSEKDVNLLKYLNIRYVVFHSDASGWEKDFDPAVYVKRADELMTRVGRFGAAIVYAVPNQSDNALKPWYEIIEIYDPCKSIMPNSITAGERFNVEFIFRSKYEDLPLYSFEQVDFNLSLEISGPSGRVERDFKSRDFLMAGFDEDARVFTTEAPSEPGKYKYKLCLTIGAGNEFEYTTTIDQSVFLPTDSGAPGLLKASIYRIEGPSTVKAGETFDLSATVSNRGDIFWRGRRLQGTDDYKGVVRLAVRKWIDENGEEVNLCGTPGCCGRGELLASVPPGGWGQAIIKLRAPDEPGRYRIVLEMVSELVMWFEDSGGERAFYEIEVTPR